MLSRCLQLVGRRFFHFRKLAVVSIDTLSKTCERTCTLRKLRYEKSVKAGELLLFFVIQLKYRVSPHKKTI
jgi:hypothetical protein